MRSRPTQQGHSWQAARTFSLPGTRTFKARKEVVLSGGAINSATLLLSFRGRSSRRIEFALTRRRPAPSWGRQEPTRSSERRLGLQNPCHRQPQSGAAGHAAWVKTTLPSWTVACAICGECVTRVISGIPEHRDSVLSEEEQAANDKVMICCAGCKSERLVLDM
jgi:hypothetical protein